MTANRRQFKAGKETIRVHSSPFAVVFLARSQSSLTSQRREGWKTEPRTLRLCAFARAFFSYEF